MTGVTIEFPNLGISLQNVQSGFEIFGFHIAFYGLIIALGMILGYLMVEWQARRTGQNPDIYLDFALIAIPVSIVCARLYYVIFQWDLYKDNILHILNIRSGGLAIYGGVIGAFATALIFSRVKKIQFGVLSDTACLGLVTGQIIGRWGNFFNVEAFGGYAGNSLFAMRIPWDVAKSNMSLSSVLAMERYVENNTILVHPAFLYESLWNLLLLIILVAYSRHKKFHGQLLLLYFFGYGIGRFWIEGLRTDQLLLWNTSLPVSMILSAAMALLALGVLLVKYYSSSKKLRLK